MSYAWLQDVAIDNRLSSVIYKQLRDGIVSVIMQGFLQPSVKLPSSRFLASYFKLHRQTIVRALNLLIEEEWLKSVPRKGIFVHQNIMLIKLKKIGNINHYPKKTNFRVDKNLNIYRHQIIPGVPGFDDGYPDSRLTPIRELARAYSQTLENSRLRKKLSTYIPIQGEQLLRTELARMMNEQRGLAIGPENILITRGRQMCYYLIANVLLKKGDNVIVTSPGCLLANTTYQTLGVNLLKVGVDANGMRIDEVALLCKQKDIRCLDIMSHYHYPTTFTLSQVRRLELLEIAELYGVAIIEDNHDCDFHYRNSPMLPLAARDSRGNVVYIGSFSKIISHATCVGYIIAPENLIRELTYFRHIIDHHCDPLLEESIGRLMASGMLQKYTDRANNVYKMRRNFAHQLLRDELCNYIDCNLPEGGLAFWSLFDKSISLPDLSARCAAKGLYVADGSLYNYDNPKQNGIRMGFAAMNESEMARAVDVLKRTLKTM